MFKIVATVIALMNGQPVGDPMLMTNKMEFSSEAECKTFQVSEKATAAIEGLKASLDARIKPGFTYIVTTKCVLQPPDDGSI